MRLHTITIQELPICKQTAPEPSTFINSSQLESKQVEKRKAETLNKQKTIRPLHKSLTWEHQRLPEVSQWCSDDSR